MATKKKPLYPREPIFHPIQEVTPAPELQEDPTGDIVRKWREKGFDNNRIASLLGIEKAIVDGIK